MAKKNSILEEKLKNISRSLYGERERERKKDDYLT